jgi:hypothetical protein
VTQLPERDTQVITGQEVARLELQKLLITLCGLFVIALGGGGVGTSNQATY